MLLYDLHFEFVPPNQNKWLLNTLNHFMLVFSDAFWKIKITIHLEADVPCVRRNFPVIIYNSWTHCQV